MAKEKALGSAIITGLQMLKTVTDANNHDTKQEYDPVNRLVKITNALNFSTEFKYDLDGRQIEVKAADGGIRKITYDSMLYSRDMIWISIGTGAFTNLYHVPGFRLPASCPRLHCAGRKPMAA